MDNDLNTFLSTIAKLESNNGQNTNHKTITSGPEKGQTAIGTYGLLPNTVDEIATRSNDKDLKSLLDLSDDEKKKVLESNPDLEKKVASNLANYVLTKQNGDTAKAAYTWLNGHNLSPEQVESRNYESSPYVQKYKKIEATISNNKKPTQISQLADNTPKNEEPAVALNSDDMSKLSSYVGDSAPASPADSDVMAVKNLYLQQQNDLNNQLAKTYRAPTNQMDEPETEDDSKPMVAPMPKLNVMFNRQPVSLTDVHNPTNDEVIENLKRRGQ